MKRWRWSRGTALICHNLGTGWHWWSKPRPGHFSTIKSPCTHWRRVGALNGFWWRENSLPSPGIKTLTVLEVCPLRMLNFMFCWPCIPVQSCKKANLVHNFSCRLHTRQPSTMSDKYQVSHRYSYFSWWWARSCPKHVEKRNKHNKKNCAPSWFYLQDKNAQFKIKTEILTVRSFTNKNYLKSLILPQSCY